MSNHKERDQLGRRMKLQYESRTRYMLPRRTYTIIRVDGKAFHTLLRNADKPFDKRVSFIMNHCALALLRQIQGARFAYTQSDEISVLLTDFERPETDAWFDGNVQKIASVSASIATATFNTYDCPRQEVGMFDSRVFTIPDRVEVENYFIWRQADAKRNFIQSIAHRYLTQQMTHGKACKHLRELLTAAGIPPERFDPQYELGSLITPDWNWVQGSAVAPLFVSNEGRERLRALIPEIWAESETTK